AQPELPERERAHDERGRLRARVPAAADDERHEERQDDGAGDLALEAAHGRRRQHLADEERREPARPLAYHAPEAGLQIGGVQGLHAAELLDVLGRLLLDAVADVVYGADAL